MGKKKKNNLAPGFRFHPTDVELVMYYLKRKVLGKKLAFNTIDELDIYKHSPWDLPHLSSSSPSTTGELKCYFYCPMAKKYGKGARLNRATLEGYWKTTGKDRFITYDQNVVGMKKTLVFHHGKPPHGIRTDWIMHEYRLEDNKLAEEGIVQDSYTLCVVFNKGGLGPKNGSEYGTTFIEDDWSDDDEGEEKDDDLPVPVAAAETSVVAAKTSVGVAAAETSVVQTPEVYEDQDDILYMLDSFNEVDNFFASI